MKNFEKNFDRLLNNLKEATDILKECNIEMQKALGETKSVKYAIFEPETESYYNKATDSLTSQLKQATLFDNIQYAKQIAESLNFREYEIKIIQLKVVK